MRAYSTDLKERLVRAVADGQPLREAARRFGVAVTTVKRAVVQQRETGALARKPIPGRPREINGEHEAMLRTRLETAPDATLQERCAWWAQHQGQPLSAAGHRMGGSAATACAVSSTRSSICCAQAVPGATYPPISRRGRQCTI